MYAIGATFRSKKTGNILEVVDIDFDYHGKALMQVSVEGGSSQLMDEKVLEENWMPL